MKKKYIWVSIPTKSGFLVAVLLLTAYCLLSTVSSAQFTNLWTQTNNPSANSDYARAITADVSGIYVAGYDYLSMGNWQWRIEKRDLTTGVLVAAFGTAGVVTNNPSDGADFALAITADASGIYVAGIDNSLGGSNYQWRIEKRDLTTGVLIWEQTNNSSAGADYAFAITADASGIYVAGVNNSPGFGFGQWHIEKRDLTTGTLIAAFGTGGVVINPSTSGAYAITAGASGIYVAGYEMSMGDSQWRMEKRDLTTGVLIASFGTGGVVTSNPSTGADNAYAITADASGIYVAGYDQGPGAGNGQWRIEKRNLTTGVLISAFGTAGAVTTNISTTFDLALAITAGAGGIYVAGYDSNGGVEWRIEKRDLTTGVLICTQTSNPSVGNDVAYAITSDASGIYVVGNDQVPGNLEWRMEKYDFCGSTVLTTSVTSQNILCNGQCTGTATASHIGGIAPYTYNWSNGQTAQTITGLCAGTYTVTVTDTTSSTATATVTITQPLGLTTTVTSTPAVCASNNGSVTVNVGGGTPGYTYSWNPSGQTTTTATGLGAGNYTATVTDVNGCTATQTVTVVSSGSITVTNQSASVCVGYTYTLPGGTVVSTGGVYIDTLASSGGCDSIITTNLIVNPNPTATAFSIPTTSGQSVTITQGQSVTLSASGGGTYSWSNGSTGSSITVTPLVTTVYCVTVTDANDCTDDTCIIVTVEQIDCSNAGELYLPSAFSPNGDEENDKLRIYYGNTACVKTFKLMIYNRWGEKVFETINPAAQWDGSFRGKTEDAAVFVYYLESTLNTGEKVIKKGNVSLFR